MPWRSRSGPVRRLLLVSALTALAALAGASTQQQQQPQPQQRQSAPCASIPAGSPALFGYQVVAEYPHDPRAFTQGLIFNRNCDAGRVNCKDGFFESTGIYGESEVRTVDLATGAVRARRRLAPQYFGEGLARLNGTLFQLTWQGPAGFSWAADDSLAPRGTFRTPLSDGWGAAADGALVVLSDGSSTLTWADPARGWARVRSLPVRLGARPVANLNELEVVNGEVWANVWYTDCVARICPQTGQITGWLLLSGLRKPGWGADADVLNGVAWDAASGRLFVTGKRWPRLYELRLTRLDANSAANKAAAAACSRPPQFEG